MNEASIAYNIRNLLCRLHGELFKNLTAQEQMSSNCWRGDGFICFNGFTLTASSG